MGCACFQGHQILHVVTLHASNTLLFVWKTLYMYDIYKLYDLHVHNMLQRQQCMQDNNQ